MIRYKNVEERYGGYEWATLEDYQELNPDAVFEVHDTGIYEVIGGVRVQVAEVYQEEEES